MSEDIPSSSWSHQKRRGLSLDQLVLTISCLTVWILSCLPWLPLSDGSIVPKIVFDTNTVWAFRAFGLCLVSSNCFFLCSMLLRAKRHSVAVVFQVFGLAALLLTAMALQWGLWVCLFTWLGWACA